MLRYIIPILLIFMLQFSCTRSENTTNTGESDIKAGRTPVTVETPSPSKKMTSHSSPVVKGEEEVISYDKLTPPKKKALEKLNKALCENDVETAKKILNKHPDLINVTDKSGRAPIHTGMMQGDEALELVKMLVSKGADVNMKDKTNLKWSPLHWGADNIVLVKYLVSKGADVTLKDTTGRTPLHIEAFRGKVENAEFFIKNGCDINEPDVLWDHTPLHYAIKAEYTHKTGEYEKTVELLINKGANLNAKDRNGETPLEMARRLGLKKLVEIMENGGRRMTEVGGRKPDAGSGRSVDGCQ